MADDKSPFVATDEDLTVYGLIVQRLTGVGVVTMNGVNELWEIIKSVFNCLKEAITFALANVQRAVMTVCTGIREKVSYFFENASEWIKNIFIAVVYRVNNMFNSTETEAEEVLEASQRVAAAIHDESTADGKEYVNNIFRDSKNECALKKDVKDNENLNQRTLELLEISNSIAENLGKTTLTDVQNIFEVLSTIVKDEYKKKIGVYSKMLIAARRGTGKKIDLKVFNRTLGIEGSVKEHYWKEAMESLIESHLAYQINDRVENLANPTKILLSPLSTPNENSTEGVYRLMGVKGEGQITADELVKILKDIKFDLSEDLAINEKSSTIMIQTKGLTLIAFQELKDNTSKGLLLVMKTPPSIKKDFRV